MLSLQHLLVIMHACKAKQVWCQRDRGMHCFWVLCCSDPVMQPECPSSEHKDCCRACTLAWSSLDIYVIKRKLSCSSLLGRKSQITMHAVCVGIITLLARTREMLQKWAATTGQLASLWKSVCWTAGARKSLCELDTYDQLFNPYLYADSSGQQVLVGACWLYRAHYYLQTIKAAVALLWFDTRMHAYGTLARPI